MNKNKDRRRQRDYQQENCTGKSNFQNNWVLVRGARGEGRGKGRGSVCVNKNLSVTDQNVCKHSVNIITDIEHITHHAKSNQL